MLSFTTDKPSALLASFNKAIEEGRITTWQKSTGGFYNHKAAQWSGKAFFSVEEQTDKLSFWLIRVKANTDNSEKTAVFSFYHGHLAETFMNHFSNQFGGAIIMSRPTPKDTDF